MNTDTEFMRRAQRTKRRDGLSTRQAILEAAGKIFAERGFTGTTGKDVCALAGANSAAMNYYFRDKEGLYAEVLVEAHRRMLALDEWEKVLASAASSEEKLRALADSIIRASINASKFWGLKLILRELAMPSPFMTQTMYTLALTRLRPLSELIRDITGLSPESAQLQRATTFFLIPCLNMLMFPETLRALVLPATLAGSEGLLDDMLTYALGGLRAMGKSCHQNSGHSSPLI